jgi:hypothetical protein
MSPIPKDRMKGKELLTVLNGRREKENQMQIVGVNSRLHRLDNSKKWYVIYTKPSAEEIGRK